MGRTKIDSHNDLSLLWLESEYSKSNFLISAKYKSSLLENQILAIVLSKVDEFYRDEKGSLICTIQGKEIRRILHKNGGSFYSMLAETAESMTGRTIGMVDPERKIFDFICVVQRATYKGGKFTVYFSPYAERFLIGIGSHFTKLSLRIMASFDKVYQFRLYELIKSCCYYDYKVKDSENTYMVSFGLAELQLNLGVVNAELDVVKRVLRDKDKPNYEKAVEIAPEKTYKEWSEFRRNILIPAIKAINRIDKKTGKKITDIDLSYDIDTGGRGGKVHKVIFTAVIINEKDKVLGDNIIDEPIDNREEFYSEMKALFRVDLSERSLEKIAVAANYDMDLIKSKYEIAKTQKVRGIVGWMIDAIKNDYSEPTCYNHKNKFNNFPQNKYDFVELEKQLLDN